jgi:peptide-methionine (S)-S-oxide reductase
MTQEDRAIFAAGCFWGVEATFRQINGVLSTRVGYTGGHLKNPTYKDVCTDTTGHAEAVEIRFNPKKVTFRKLTDIFFELHDASQINKQGPDVGTQYRSAIFYTNEEQKKTAEIAKAEWQRSEKYQRQQIMTEITSATDFYPAETYHQQYFEKYGYHPCVNFLPLPK